MDFLPVFLNIKQRPCLVVGGGEVAARKVDLLRRAQGRVTVIAPALGPRLTALHEQGGIDYRAGAFRAGDLDTRFTLVIAATDDAAVNRLVHDEAERLGIPVNVVDQPALCTFVVPSIFDRAPLIAAISTGGAAPVLARQLRARLETLVPANYGRLAALTARFRDEVKQRLPSGTARRRFWEDALQGNVAELVLAGKEAEAEQALRAALDAAEKGGSVRGEVYLVGAGPGDPDLLTFRALRLMQQADVVLYDRLVSPAIMDLVRRDADRIYVGKRRSYHTVRQEEINALLVRLAKEGKRVLRLKGGDPFIFGRGGEEIETLAAEGISFQIVPGITAANGCASYGGIPLTHRDYAQSVVFVTGHLKDGTMDLNWPALVQPAQTLVVYMGLTGLDILCARLQEHGMAPTMPAALIEHGTVPAQRVIIGTLATLPGLVAATQVKGPTLLIVGEVVSLQHKYAWYGAPAEK